LPGPSNRKKRSNAYFKSLRTEAALLPVIPPQEKYPEFFTERVRKNLTDLKMEPHSPAIPIVHSSMTDIIKLPVPSMSPLNEREHIFVEFEFEIKSVVDERLHQFKEIAVDFEGCENHSYLGKIN